MKVLFTFGGLPHYYNFILNKINNIKGVEVIVVVPNEKSKTLGSGVHESTEGIEFKVIRIPEITGILGKASFKGLSKILLEEKPDILVTGWPYVLSYLYNPKLLFTVKKLGIKLIYKDIPFNIPKFQEAKKYYKDQKMQLETMENEGSENSFLYTLKYQLVTWARKVFFNMMDAHVYYTEEAFDILPTYGLPKEKIFIIYNSPDTDQLLKTRENILNTLPILAPNPYRLLHVGRLVKWKRVDLLIQVLSKLKNKFPGIELTIVGKGPEEEALKKLTKELKIEESVVFVGSVYDPEILGKYFLESSIYVLAGMGGLSINEAMSFGKPVICSVADGTEKALVKDGYNGKYFKNGDGEDLYKKIDFLLSDLSELKKYGENSLHIIKEEINIHTVIEGYVKAFNYVTNNKENIKYIR